MTPEQIAEARRLVDEANLWSDTSVEWADFASQAKRLVPQLLDALEAAELELETTRSYRDESSADVVVRVARERDEYRNLSHDMLIERDTARTRLAEVERERDQWEQSWNDQVSVTTVRINERDTARAQVETLAEALRKFRDHHFYGNASAEARAALKAAELDNTSGESK